MPRIRVFLCIGCFQMYVEVSVAYHAGTEGTVKVSFVLCFWLLHPYGRGNIRAVLCEIHILIVSLILL